jgi:hypothetical protein
MFTGHFDFVASDYKSPNSHILENSFPIFLLLLKYFLINLNLWWQHFMFSHFLKTMNSYK